MAYDPNNPPACRTQRVGSTPGGADWSYVSPDAIGTVTSGGYFIDAGDLGMQVGDEVSVFDTNLGVVSHTYVSAINAAGAATVVAI